MLLGALHCSPLRPENSTSYLWCFRTGFVSKLNNYFGPLTFKNQSFSFRVSSTFEVFVVCCLMPPLTTAGALLKYSWGPPGDILRGWGSFAGLMGPPGITPRPLKAILEPIQNQQTPLSLPDPPQGSQESSQHAPQVTPKTFDKPLKGLPTTIPSRQLASAGRAQR